MTPGPEAARDAALDRLDALLPREMARRAPQCRNRMALERYYLRP
jgi:hypothetical protein